MAAYELTGRFAPASSPVLLTGVQAIVRLLVEQRAADLAAGRDVGLFVTGYQGSPLGGLDRLLAGMPDLLQRNAIHFRPAVNEELAATAVWGSQSPLPAGTSRYDGVVGVWYGKAPGVDRATDALRHLTMYGVDPRGGVVILAGDDPAAKSSTVPAVSERTLAALEIPVLFPRNATEVVSLGRHAVALSRACGSPVALKIVADVADGAWVVRTDDAGTEPVQPELVRNGTVWTYRRHAPAVGSARIVAVEAELVGPRAEMIQLYAGANHLDVVTADCADARVGLVAAGPAYDSMMQVLHDSGFGVDALADSGIRVLRLGMVHPLGRAGIREFARGLERIVVVEDKTAFVETQLREILYDLADRPQVIGKLDADGRVLVPADGELTPGRLAEPLRRALSGTLDLAAPLSRKPLPLLTSGRVPYFCSGCPHNRSTGVPEGSLAAGGIGCHTLVTTSRRTDSAVTAFTQMGGEGAQWIGQADFTDVEHIFQNLGDGTFFHSGQLAIQACVAAGVNITYKVLHNRVVAMTGAQDPQGALSVGAITHKLTAEGVARIIVCSDRPDELRGASLAPRTAVWHRDRLDEAQRVLRETPGVTVLIYDQPCAADARRRRNRGTLPAAPFRVVINEDVCEGCGDCGRVSNCLSVQPVPTEFGDKTRIDQNSCNSDYSCLLGDCPAFMTVIEPPAVRAGSSGPLSSGTHRGPELDRLPPPVLRNESGTVRVLLAGVGGTGIVTVNQVLATAAVIAGLDAHLLDQIGLSQKAGPVVGHLKIARSDLEPSNRLSPAQADVVLAFDLLTMADPGNLGYADPSRTLVYASTSRTPTGHEVYDRAVGQPPPEELMTRISSQAERIETLDLAAAASALLGDSTAANLLLVGMAVQDGALPLPPEAVEEALAVNGAAVQTNASAFRWGRLRIADPVAFESAVASRRPHTSTVLTEPGATATGFVRSGVLTGELRRLVAIRADELCAFQDARLARDYVRIVEAVADRERRVGTRTELSEAVARYLFKLTAYKDEYEVARLLLHPRARDFVEAAVPGATEVTFRLHPPMLRALGRGGKLPFGPALRPALAALPPLRRLRGTPLDPFGHTEVRRFERELVRHYRAVLHELVTGLTAQSYDRALAFAVLPDLVRGYEDVKLASIGRYRVRLRELGFPDLDRPATSVAAP